MVIGKTGKDTITSDENPNLVSMLAHAKGYAQDIDDEDDESDLYD